MQAPPPGAMPGPMPMGMPLNMPSPEQMEALRAKIVEDARKAGMTVPQFLEHLKQQQMRMQQQQQEAAAQRGPPPQTGPPPTPMAPGPPTPQALAVAKFLQSQDLKPRTSILNGERKQMFRVKRAMRALQSPTYETARKKNPDLPAITDRVSLENTFKLLPMSILALRVSKVDPHAGHNHGKPPKRVKGLWTVRIEQQQEVGDDMYYVWLWEGGQLRRKLYAGLAAIAIFAIVLYPLWPAKLRLGVYYLTWGLLGLLGLFFVMAIFRVILFFITYLAVSPGLWLFPNLWEDVSFVDSFKPVWAWNEIVQKPKKKKRARSVTAGSVAAQSMLNAATGQPAPATATTTATDTMIATLTPEKRNKYTAPQVEEVDE